MRTSTTTAGSALLDYCAVCRDRGRPRLQVVTVPDAVRWNGGPGVLASYACPHCGHRWTCSWSLGALAGAA